MLVLNFWTEMGLLGLISALGLLAYWLKAGFELMREQFWIGAGLVSALAYWMIHGLVDVPFFKNDLAMIWWLLFTLTITARYCLKDRARAD